MRSGRTRRVTAGNAFVHDRKAAAHLQNAQAVVQHALGVGDVVADWQRQAAQVRLQQQVGLGVGVVCREGEGDREVSGEGDREAEGREKGMVQGRVVVLASFRSDGQLAQLHARTVPCIHHGTVLRLSRSDPAASCQHLPAVRESAGQRTDWLSTTFSRSSLCRTGSSSYSAAAHSTGSRACLGRRVGADGSRQEWVQAGMWQCLSSCVVCSPASSPGMKHPF